MIGLDYYFNRITESTDDRYLDESTKEEELINEESEMGDGEDINESDERDEVEQKEESMDEEVEEDIEKKELEDKKIGGDGKGTALELSVNILDQLLKIYKSKKGN